MLDMDEGSWRIGEFAFGIIMALKSIQKTLCLMKKIGGTIHLAVGSSYPETGSKNKSNLHRDIMCDFSKSREVYADDEMVYKNGKFFF